MSVRIIRALRRGLTATVSVPGSKSIANRALVCAALADGASSISGVPDGDDSTALVEGLGVLGVSAEIDAHSVRIVPPDVRWAAGSIDARLAGTTSRFLTAVAALGTSTTIIDGAAPLRGRPFGPLHDALRTLGASIEPLDRVGHLPVAVRGPVGGGRVELPGDVSSQFVTALMLIAPAMPTGLVLELTSPLVSRPYVEMTASVMEAFGASGVVVGERRIEVAPGSYTPIAHHVEPDASSASYPLAIAAVTGGRVTVPGLGARSIQGDIAIARLLEQMGCRVDLTDDSITVEGPDVLRGLDVDLAATSDLVPTIAAVAAVAATPTRISGVGFIRDKESDRLGDLASELGRVGVRCTETEDGLHIEPSRDALNPGRVATHHDHRLAMAFAVLGSVRGGIEIEHPEVVSKSWPGFWAVLDRLA